MSIAQDIQNAIARVHDQESFIQRVLVDTLDWQLDPDALDIEDTAYEYTADELNSPLLDEKCNGRALQLTFQSEIPWGVFLIEFANEEPFVQSRGLTMPLRQLLNALVPKRRRDSGLPAWDRENLLFICTYDYRHFRFAYFQAAPGKIKTAPLKIFGWNQGDTAVRTLCEHNLPHLRWDHTQNWPEAFNIEKVTKDFYSDYADVFRRMEDAIGEHNDIDGDELRMFTQMLFNRLMFLRFIERKGWLEFGDTPDYLANLYSAGGIDGQSFYASRLMPLFFEGLAVEGQQESPLIGKVPFLNGGLFERADLDDQVDDIPDEAFEPVLGLRGLFYRYNFTISESTPLDIEVAVDPEMLGKVFEELVTGRHESGSYYTPRPVVAFMCREALKGYLNDKTSATEAAIEKLIDDHEVAEDLSEGQAREILWYLDTIKACDPACGSGAYLLGLMQELIAARRALQSDKLKTDPKFLYDLKLGIIGRNLYGVDNDLFATNIAKLRLWLSLSVEAEQPQPLPNLDFKIETGDSLLGPCRELLGPMFNNELSQRAQEIQELKLRHEMAHGQTKQDLFTEIEEKIDYLKSLAGQVREDDAIIWPADFPEVFCPRDKFEATFKNEFGFVADMDVQKTFKVTTIEPGGFDVVLANPPYVRQELIKDIKPQLQELYPEVYGGRADLYVYFYARAVEMLAPGGMLAFISSNKFFRASYGKGLRAFLGENCDIQSITDFGDSPIFEATAYPMIFVAQKTGSSGETWFTDTRVSNGNGLDVKTVIRSRGFALASDAVTGEAWSFADRQMALRMEKMIQSGPPLKEHIDGLIFAGIKTGYNTAFWIDSRTRAEIVEADPASNELIKPLCRGDDVARWSFEKNPDRWIIYTPRGTDIRRYPAIEKHLRQYKGRLEKRALDQKWFELQQAQTRYAAEFDSPKIVYPDIALAPRFALDDQEMYIDMTAFCIPTDDLFLLGVLNSKPVHEFYAYISAQIRGGYLRYKTQYVERIPIPRAQKAEQTQIAKLVQKCIDAGGKNCEKWENEIDALVAGLYGVEV